MTMLTILLIVVAYFVGSCCSAVLLCRLMRLPDPREHGSHNPGATNALRLGGARLGATVLLLDLGKGALLILFGRYLAIEPIYLGVIGMAAVIGHIYPLYFYFRGGKGVATALGVMLAMSLTTGMLVIAIWVLLLLLSGYSSLAAIVALCAAPLISYYLIPDHSLSILLMAMLIIYRHYPNIIRLYHHVEPQSWPRVVKGDGERGDERVKIEQIGQKKGERNKN